MRASNVTKAVALALSVAWVAGCSTSGTTESTGSTAGTDTGSTQGVSQNTGVSGSSMDDVANLQTVFYFDFDQSVVKADGFADLEKHAAYLAANPSAQVILEGHADERGTREYNMALGERRAKAVSRFLQVNGVSGSQVESISFGEEKPAVLGHSDSSWSQNRRVELKYVSR
ncbi:MULTISPECIES: peptidoglycan-associated lipoprotein Pal [unclassified Neptuniibacter]|jgi:peptidoglycan-associated lipoprotein|uniref:peptidoglycan-associated lipoprotein Pal n=1 Tax=Neptuniibacter TaxID=459520 RepID=UPI0026E38A09|nr:MULTISPECIES: peptidoglycan-associated lipoprotein Pal [unclassified Neptuniibacter]MDO6515353.1 peptidoglycan-associated lipoprotein Pal [Neptuniibacter sp. 2_MG-2023]MDO6592282.1 peptidoglycan-associated lipoprotein Pal [Neptuniibacter sp. 1_MG-2023]